VQQVYNVVSAIENLAGCWESLSGTLLWIVRRTEQIL
jgi:hypothetical protein